MARSLSPDKARLVAIRATRLTGDVCTFTHWAEPAGSRPLAPFVEVEYPTSGGRLSLCSTSP